MTADASPTSVVHVDRRSGVGVVTLDDPARRNALTLPMVDEIVAALDDLEADGSIGAIVVAGAGPAFCAGADLGDLGAADEGGLRRIYEGFLRVARSPLPTLAAVGGPAVGAGMNLALACDVRLVSPSGRFTTRFLDLGLHPGGGHTWMLRRIAGPQAAAATLLFGETVGGEDAVRAGLAWRCTADDGSLLDEALALAARAASAPRDLAVRAKATLARMHDVGDHAAAVDVELEAQVWSTRQPWFTERLAALRAKTSSR